MTAATRATRVEQLDDDLWLYSDDSRRNARGQLSGQQSPEFGTHTITQADASQLQARRHEIAREKAAEGMLRAIRSTEPEPCAEPTDAWGVVVEKQTELAASADTYSTQAAKFVGDAAGMLAPKQAAISSGGGNTYVLNITDSAAERLGLIEGEVVDVEPYGYDNGELSKPSEQPEASE